MSEDRTLSLIKPANAAVAGLEQLLTRPLTESDLDRATAALAAPLIELVDALPGVTFRGHRTARLPNTVAFSVAGADSIALLAGLDLEGICASSGSACASGFITPSHVLLALGAGAAESNALVRFSLGRETSVEDMGAVHKVLPAIIARTQLANKDGGSL